MVCASNDPKPSPGREPQNSASGGKKLTPGLIDKVLNSEVRIHEATEALIREGIAEIAIKAWSEHLGRDNLFELTFKVRARVEEGKTPADCDHVAIEFYNDAQYIGSAWARFDEKTLAGRPLSDAQVIFLRKLISETQPDEIEKPDEIHKQGTAGSATLTDES